MKRIFYNCWLLVLLSSLSCCTAKYHRGDFTIIVEEEKYEALGGAVKTASYDILYKGKELDWSKYSNGRQPPEIWSFHDVQSDPQALLAEAYDSYYLLKPAGDGVQITWLGLASYNGGGFENKPYTNLFHKGLFFHQPGRLINLSTFKKDTLAFTPSGRVLATNNAVSKIVYLDGVFKNETEMQKIVRETEAYRQSGVYYPPPDEMGVFKITEWDLRKDKVSQYTYTDTTVWNTLYKYYKDHSYLAVSEDYDSSFVFNLFKWDRDSTGDEHLIPKNSEVNHIRFYDAGRDSALQLNFK